MRKTMLVVSASAVVMSAGLALAGPAHTSANPTGRRPILANNPMDAFPITENFDTTALGGWPCPTASPGCAGPNGWGLWPVAETSSSTMTPGPNNGTIINTNSHSSPNSLRMGRATDITQTGNITSGQWDVTVWTFVPSGISGTGSQAYVIVMNTFNPPTFANNNWSIQFQLDPTTNQIKDANTGAAHGALILDQWVQVRLHIDIDADTYTAFYNGAQVWGPIPYSSATAAGGAHRIQCLDLFVDEADGVLYDDVSVQASGVPTTCYPNCDGSTTVPFLNVNDFICFQTAFAAGQSYANCDHSTTPPVLNVNDFICFQTAFAAGCTAP
jgi:hypothetical protein